MVLGLVEALVLVSSNLNRYSMPLVAAVDLQCMKLRNKWICPPVTRDPVALLA